MIKAESSGADALVLDLEDAVESSRLPVARKMVHDYLAQHRSGQQRWVRINPLDTDLALDDLAAVVRAAPDGILLPKGSSAKDVIRLACFLDALEARDGVEKGSISIMPVATETPSALFSLGGYQDCGPRLYALTWGAEDLAAAIGASTNRVENGEYEFTYQLARSLCLLGAHAAGVPAIDTIWSNFRDKEGLEKDAIRARKAGFSGKIAIHPDQVSIINDAFTPDAKELAYAKQVIQAFENAGGAGTVQLDGRMLDRPHLKQATQVLARGRQR